jgi:hypothetical protein
MGMSFSSYPKPEHIQVTSGCAYLKNFINSATGTNEMFNVQALEFNTQINSLHEHISKDAINKMVNVPKAFIHINIFIEFRILIQKNH